MSRVFCSCNGRKCDGVCREKHLYRRRDIDRCPAAYDVDEFGREIGQLTVTEAFEIIKKKGKK